MELHAGNCLASSSLSCNYSCYTSVPRQWTHSLNSILSSLKRDNAINTKHVVIGI
jgi:hypothetical protein